MPDQKIAYIVGESVTYATGNLTRAVNIPYGAQGVEVRITTTATNFWQFCPKLKQAFKFTASGSVYRDDTVALSERGTNQTATFNSMTATNDFIYIGCEVPFRGVYVNVVNANGTASVLSGTYTKNDGTYAALTVTDNTASGGATLAIDNTITWTMPTDWTKASVNGGAPLYYARLTTDGGTDSATSLAEVIPLSVQTANSTGAKGVVAVTTAVSAPRYWFSREHVGGIEAIAADTNVVRFEFLCTSPSQAVFVQ